MKTRKPLILTGHIAEEDLLPFDLLRQEHFPPDRNFLHAHLTMFHRLPGEYSDRIVDHLEQVASEQEVFKAEVSGLRHLGAGVAYSISSPALEEIRMKTKKYFASWLGPQDMQTWHPHITIQNKATKAKADDLYHHLSQGFAPHSIRVTGLDLWEYLGGPWKHESCVRFCTS